VNSVIQALVQHRKMLQENLQRLPG